MIALDTNVLIPFLVESPEHSEVMKWADSVQTPLCVTSINLSEALRLLTHPRVFPNPMRLHEAAVHLREWMSNFSIIYLEDNSNWLEELEILTSDLKSLRGNDVFDARIALTLRFNGVREICTLDANFRRFLFLKVISPT